ncbi:hypothetical protein AGMMS49531_11400 [Endomicrobiia bacterium]|nr:hypothetical protein AGMMS49531_11400 [Endomicrobiia bacterium]GHT65588.1 hypothetical protein AGMMS49556_05690 [Endomicrobiia bacterium]
MNCSGEELLELTARFGRFFKVFGYFSKGLGDGGEGFDLILFDFIFNDAFDDVGFGGSGGFSGFGGGGGS